jgi:hypothetical protein
MIVLVRGRLYWRPLSFQWRPEICPPANGVSARKLMQAISRHRVQVAGNHLYFDQLATFTSRTAIGFMNVHRNFIKMQKLKFQAGK